VPRALEALRRGDRAPSITGEPTPRANSLKPQAARTSRAGPGQRASGHGWIAFHCWLITRFVDRSPRFIWIDSPEAMPEKRNRL